MSENNEIRGRLEEEKIRFNHESGLTCDCRCAQLILIQFVFLSMAKSSILPKSSILLAVLQKFDGTFSCDSAPTTNHIFVVPNYNSQSLAVKQPRIMMISTANATRRVFVVTLLLTKCLARLPEVVYSGQGRGLQRRSPSCDVSPVRQ